MVALYERLEKSVLRPTEPRRRWPETLLVLAVAAALVFCHGCHGDQDTELITGGWWVLF